MRKILVFLDNPRVYTGWSEKAAKRVDRFQTGWLDDGVVHIGEEQPAPKRKTIKKAATKRYSPKPKAPRQADESDEMDDLMAGLDEQLHTE